MAKHSIRKTESDQLLVRKLGGLKKDLRKRAEENGHSMEEEARNILRIALKERSPSEKGLGTRIAERFRGLGLREEDFPRLEIKIRSPKLDE